MLPHGSHNRPEQRGRRTWSLRGKGPLSNPGEVCSFPLQDDKPSINVCGTCRVIKRPRWASGSLSPPVADVAADRQHADSKTSIQKGQQRQQQFLDIGGGVLPSPALQEPFSDGVRACGSTQPCLQVATPERSMAKRRHGQVDSPEVITLSPATTSPGRARAPSVRDPAAQQQRFALRRRLSFPLRTAGNGPPRGGLRLHSRGSNVQRDVRLLSSPSSVSPSPRKVLRLASDAGLCNLRFNASEVASLIGLHRHAVSLHALVRCWGRHHQASLRRWQRSTGGVTLPEWEYARHADPLLRAAVQVAVTTDMAGPLSSSAEKKIEAAVSAGGAPLEVQRAVVAEALGRARRARGTALEGDGLNAYEQVYGCRVLRRNMDALRGSFGGTGDGRFEIGGRVDGFQEVAGQRWVVEHKRRQRNLFSNVPCYEEVQCQVYMALSGSPACCWVQTLGSEVEARTLARCDVRWGCIQGRLKAVARLLRRLAAGITSPPARELAAIQRAELARAPPWPKSPAPLLPSADEPRRLAADASTLPKDVEQLSVDSSDVAQTSMAASVDLSDSPHGRAASALMAVPPVMPVEPQASSSSMSLTRPNWQVENSDCALAKTCEQPLHSDDLLEQAAKLKTCVGLLEVVESDWKDAVELGDGQFERQIRSVGELNSPNPTISDPSTLEQDKALATQETELAPTQADSTVSESSVQDGQGYSKPLSQDLPTELDSESQTEADTGE